jgi:hypothetical protein
MCQHPTRLIPQLDVMVLLRPVIAQEQQHLYPAIYPQWTTLAASRKTSRDPIDTVLWPVPGRRDIPPAIRSSGPAGKGTIFVKDSMVQRARVLTCQRLPQPSLHYADPAVFLLTLLASDDQFPQGNPHRDGCAAPDLLVAVLGEPSLFLLFGWYDNNRHAGLVEGRIASRVEPGLFCIAIV